jgi:acetoin utilization protein AcuC
MAELSGTPLDPATEVPASWREYAEARTGLTAPLRMTDGHAPMVRDWAGGYDPEDPLDAAILATRAAVFPHHGLDPNRD